MVFPAPGATVSTGFWDLRPYSKPWHERTYIHRAWDFANYDNRLSLLRAPERGLIFYQYIVRCPLDVTWDHKWPGTPSWYMFSNFYADTMGALAILMGESGNIWAFGHLVPDSIIYQMTAKKIPIEWGEKKWLYNKYVRWIISFDHMREVLAGDVIGYIGNAGYSTGPHCHMQVHESKNYNSRIDPAEYWPDVKINDNGAGPSKGTRAGAPHVPPADLSLSYLRGE